MPSYSAQFKEQAVRRLMPPNSQTVSMVSRDLGLAAPTLYAWKRQFESKGAVVPAKSSSPDKWDMKSKLAAIIQTASMNEAERSAYCQELISRKFMSNSSGLGVPDLCRELGISSATFYKWRAKYGGMDTSMMRTFCSC